MSKKRPARQPSKRRAKPKARAAKMHQRAAFHAATAYAATRRQFGRAIREFQALAKDKPIADEFYYLGSAWFRKGDFAAAGRPLGTVLRVIRIPRELDRRRREWRAPEVPSRGWRHLYARHVLAADQGADLDFLGPSENGV